jgi:hypothetical protein
MSGSVWTVDFSALTHLAVAFAALLHLRASITISRQHLFVTSLFFIKVGLRVAFMCSFLIIYTVYIET